RCLSRRTVLLSVGPRSVRAVRLARLTRFEPVLGRLLTSIVLGVPRDRNDRVSFADTREDHSHGVTTLGRYVAHGASGHLTAGLDAEDLIGFVDHDGADERSSGLGDPHRLDTESATTLPPVRRDTGA